MGFGCIAFLASACVHDLLEDVKRNRRLVSLCDGRFLNQKIRLALVERKAETGKSSRLGVRGWV
jgi:hypothetical protein